MADKHRINYIKRYSNQKLNSEMPSIQKCYSIHSVASTATTKHSNLSKRRSAHKIKESRTRTFFKTMTTQCIPSDLFDLHDSNEILEESRKLFSVQELLTKTLKPPLIEHLQKISRDAVPYDENDSISSVLEPTLQRRDPKPSTLQESRFLRLSTISNSKAKKSPYSQQQIKQCTLPPVKRHSWRY